MSTQITTQNDTKIFEEYSNLVKAFKGGDETAFEDIYEKSKRLVYSTCFFLLNDKDDAEDAMQETYLTVYRKINALTDDTKFLGWLKQIASTKALDLYRRKKGDVSFDDAIESDEHYDSSAYLDTLPDAYVLQKDHRDTIHKIIRQTLSDVQYQTVVLFYYDELPVETIASIMNVPAGTVKSRLNVSRGKIEEAIAEYDKKNGKLVRLAPAAGLFKLFDLSADELKVPALNMNPGKLYMKKPTARKASLLRQFLATRAGVITMLSASVLIIATIAGVAIHAHRLADKDDDKQEAEEKITEIAELQVDVTDAPDVTESTEPAETVFYDPPIELSLNDVAEPDQLSSFVACWKITGYDCTNVPDDIVSRIFTSDSGCALPMDKYFDDFSWNGGNADPLGLFDSSFCHKMDANYLYWVEENILNISAEDRDKINSALMGMPAEYGITWSQYIADDGNYYYAKGDSGNNISTIVDSILFDGARYYVTSMSYSDFDTDIYANATYRYYVLELKNIDGEDYWTIISCSDAPFVFESNGTNENEPSATEIVEESIDLSAATDTAEIIKTAPDTGWKDMYLELLNSMTLDKLGTTDFVEGTELYCRLVYINGDDVPELVCYATDRLGGTHINLYAIAGDEVILVTGESFYQLQLTIGYFPYENFICDGSYLGEMGAAKAWCYEELNDDFMSEKYFEINVFSYDCDIYSDATSAAEAGAVTAGVEYYYFFDGDTGTSYKMTQDEIDYYDDLLAFEKMDTFTGENITLADFIGLLTAS